MSIDATEQIEKFQEFFELNYKEQLQNSISKGFTFVEVDFSELSAFDSKLAEELLDEPEETLKAAEKAVQQYETSKNFRIRFKNLSSSQEILIRNIRSRHLGKFIVIEGIIRQSSEVRPQAVSAKFECPSCGNMLTISQTEATFREPVRCTCGRKGQFRLLNKELVDVQRLVVEESPESLEGGAQPKRLQVFLREDLVEPRMEKRTTPGSKVVVTGIVYEVPISTRTGAPSTRFDLAMSVNFIEPVEEDFSEIIVNPEDEKKIKKLAKDPRIYEKLIGSIAPSIYGHNRIKEAVAFQMFGGVRKIKGDGTKVRGDIHILAVGDPGVSKSQILTFVDLVSPKSRYVAGRSASGAGLTSTVVKDEFLRGWALEAGAMVLADKGILIIDEMDKISHDDTAALHEAMEQQSYHPDFQLMFADGSTKKIGDFVNSLLEKNKNSIINAKNCEILPIDNYEILTTDFSKIYPTKINRISRHKAPDYFFEISFSNGRKILVTPEHPFFVFRDGAYKEIPANSLNINDFIPAPRKLNLNFKKYTVPIDIVNETYSLLKNLRMADGRLDYNIKRGQNVHHKTIEKYLCLIEARLNTIDWQNPKDIRKKLFISLKKLSKECNCCSASIANKEKRKDENYLLILNKIAKEKFIIINDKVDYLKKIIKSDLRFVHIKSIRKIKNDSVKWVYDVTVEPNQTFISEGLVLHNSLSIAKANIQATLRTQTSILAAANPKLGRFDPFRPIAEQIDLPPALISRFDLIFVLRDIPNKDLDNLIADRILISQGTKGYEPEIPPPLLRKYLAYTKQRYNPVLTDEAKKIMQKFYVDIRTSSGEGEGAIKTIPLGPRQLEAAIRLAEASAKIRLSETIDEQDAKRALNLLKWCLSKIGVDPETGKMDIDRINTGISTSTRGKILTVRDFILKLDSDGKKTISIEEDLKPLVEEKGISEDKLEEALRKLKSSGEIFTPKPGFVQKI